MTTWAAVPGWAGLYEVSDAGDVRSLDRKVRGRRVQGRVLRPAPNPKGYLIVILSGLGRRVGYPVHRLVAEAFLGPRPIGMHTCHNDGDNRNNTVTNLRYDTQSANELDNVRFGRNANAAKTHCLRGHEYTPENTMRGGGTSRRCRACHYARNAESRRAS